MAKSKAPLSELRFPVGGLNRQAGFDQQPPYTTPYCQNVFPFDVVNLSNAQMHGMRQRGGARPGLVRAYAQPCGSGPTQLLDFASILNNGVASNILLSIAGGTLYQNASGAMTAVTGGPQFGTAALKLQGTQVGASYYIADVGTCNVSGQDGTISGNELLDHSGTITDWRTLNIDTNNDVVWISGNVPTEANVFPISAVYQTYIVFSGTMTGQTGGAAWQIGRMPKVFNPAQPAAAIQEIMGNTLPIPNTNYVVGQVTCANGQVALSGTGASWAVPANVPQASVANNMILTIPNANGIGTQDYAVAFGSVVHGGASPYTQGGLTLVDTTVDANTTVPVQYTLSWSSSYYGVPPLGCPLCCTYRGRLVFAGPGAVWYMSRVLNPNDWDYGYDPNDPSRAVGGTDTTTGGIPEPITALMPHSDQYLIFGCERSLWLLTGDPAYGGTITALSREIGVLGPGAWCNLPDGSLIVLSRDGLYQIPPGASSYPQPISRQVLPNELLDTDWVNSAVSMCYDTWLRGIHLSITTSAGSAGIHYFIDWTTHSFWPVTLPGPTQPTAMVRYVTGSGASSRVLFGGIDGYVRRYSQQSGGTGATWVQGTSGGGVLTLAGGGVGWTTNLVQGQVFAVTTPIGVYNLTCAANTATTVTMTTAGPTGSGAGLASWVRTTTDDGTPLNSVVCYGPFRVGGPGYYGEILQIMADLDSNGQGAAWGIFPGDTAEGAVQAAVTANAAATAPWNGTLLPGMNHRQFPRASGAAFVIMVSGTWGWAIEGLRIESRKKGPIR
jgi:hypothetical protein